MKRASVALAVHDLKNALGALQGQLDALVHQCTPAAAVQAQRHCAELRQRFVQYLTVYGTDQEITAHCEDESPSDLLHRLASACDLGEGAEVGVDAAMVAPPFWYFDLRLVHMALEAAVHNARRFARGRVELGASAVDDHLRLTVSDDGPGLGAHDPSALSTGLGLHLCRAVAKAHVCAGRQGRVALRNRPEGGALFELWLP
jgi:signal transduction histidine kinase